MPAISLLLNFSIPPRNRPRPGASTPLSRLPVLVLVRCLFSKMMPFSLASSRRFASLARFFPSMPFRWRIGILSCSNKLPLAPRVWIRRSVALCLCTPVAVVSAVEEFPRSNRCDSLRRRCKSRSCFRFSVSDSSSEPKSALGSPTALESLGGLELYRIVR